MTPGWRRLAAASVVDGGGGAKGQSMEKTAGGVGVRCCLRQQRDGLSGEGDVRRRASLLEAAARRSEW